MADNPTHVVLIKDANGKELRQLGPYNYAMALDRAGKINNRQDILGEVGNVAVVAENPRWDPSAGREIRNCIQCGADTTRYDRFCGNECKELFFGEDDDADPLAE